MKGLRIIVFAIFVFGCGNKENEKNKKAEHEISSLLDSTVKEKSDTFKLEGLSFDWDSLLIVPPYTVLKKVNISKINVSALKETNIEFRDDICVLAFLKGGQITSYTEISRKYDFSKLSTTKFYSKGDLFQLIQDPLNASHYTVKEK